MDLYVLTSNVLCNSVFFISGWIFSFTKARAWSPFLDVFFIHEVGSSKALAIRVFVMSISSNFPVLILMK